MPNPVHTYIYKFMSEYLVGNIKQVGVHLFALSLMISSIVI